MQKFRHVSLVLTLGLGLAAVLLLGRAVSELSASNAARGRRGATMERLGQSLTLLSDGRWLLVGGEGPQGPVATALIWDPHTETLVPLAQPLHARAWHSATVAPDGSVVIFGGVGVDGHLVADSEVYVPTTQTFTSLPTLPLTVRAHHTATLLTDGQVLIAGGIASNGEILNTAELWDFRTPQSSLLVPHSLTSARRDQTAVLLPNGTVLLWGGTDQTGAELAGGEWYDPATQTWTALPSGRTLVSTADERPRITASVPTDGTSNVPLESLIALRFSLPLLPATLTPTTVTLREATASHPISVVAAEGGMLAFVLPQLPLRPASTYFLTVHGPTTDAGTLLPETTLHFTTASRRSDSPRNNSELKGSELRNSALKDVRPNALTEEEEDDWVPDENNLRGDWRINRPDPAIRSLPPLRAAAGITALSGQVLSVKGKPLSGVTLRLHEQQTRSDANGQFLLQRLPAGVQVLQIDGRAAGPGNVSYGFFAARVDVTAGQTTVLPFTIWLPKIDTAHAVPIPSPTTSAVVVTTPHIPGLELHLPAGVTIHDQDGNPVTEVSITPIPIDRTPFPLPARVPVPVYFTIQPGSGEIIEANIKARLIYPNYTQQPPGTRFNFWQYEPDEEGWETYGEGSVTADGTQVAPDPAVGIYEFTGAMVAGPGYAPDDGPEPCDSEQECCDHNSDGNPVDLFTGLKEMGNSHGSGTILLGLNPTSL